MVVAAADDASFEQRVADARAGGAGALVEVARVLVEDGRQQRVAEEIAVEEGAVCGGVAFAEVAEGERPQA